MEQQIYLETDFNDVFDSQKTFRILLDSMSRPGKIFRLAKHRFIQYPEGLNPNILTILKTLGDNEVTFSICNLGDLFKRYIELNTRIISTTVNCADYVILNGNQYFEKLYILKCGTLEFPEDSTTLIIMVENILEGEFRGSSIENICLEMKGPGIKNTNVVTISGLHGSYISSLCDINSVFPIGIDTIMVDLDGNIISIPRTTKVEVK